MESVVKFTKIKDAEPMGIYEPTTIDAQKAAADFLLVSVGPLAIRWKSGLLETVTRRKLDALKKNHSWATDF